MSAETRASTPDTDVLIVSLDVGSSSVRTLLFDGRGAQVKGFGLQQEYDARTTPEGGVEIDAPVLSTMCDACLSHIHGQLRAAKRQATAIAFDTFWHSFLVVGADERPVTPILHLFDTRSAPQARRLREQEGDALHARTGCVAHPSYWPAKLLWLAETRPDEFRAAHRLLSFGEFYYLRLFGKAAASVSMLSGTGLWNPNEGRYDEETLGLLPIEPSQLAHSDEIDTPLRGLRPESRSAWPDFADLPWFPALGDGACNSVGSGCVTPDRFALMVGTSGAMRAVVARDRMEPLPGVWCYRVDRKRFVVGGALSNGGAVFEWMDETLRLPPAAEREGLLAAAKPLGHGMTVLPLLLGERSPRWNADTRAAIAGLSLHHQPLDLLQASLEAVALTFRQIFAVMTQTLPAPREVIASGGALRKSAAWTQMMADALGRSVRLSEVDEATSRGAALLTLEALGHLSHLEDTPAATGRCFEPTPAHREAYERQLEKMERLYAALYPEGVPLV